MNTQAETNEEILHLLQAIRRDSKIIDYECDISIAMRMINNSSMQRIMKTNREIILNLHRLRIILQDEGVWKDDSQ